MAEARTTPSHVEAGHLSRTVAEAAVRSELDRILSSHEFRSSRRCQDFLRYVVENTLAGKADQLKERTIGIDVFGRPVAYDPSDDATVRVKAGEVRKRLSIYYSGDGRNDEVRIELPSGTYIPEFRSVTPDAITPAVQTPELLRNAGALSGQNFQIPKLVLPLVIAAACLIPIVWLVVPHSMPQRASVLDQFWAPLLQQASTPVVLSAAYVPVYAEDFTLLTDQFVGGGDVLAIASLSVMLNNMHRAYEVKIGPEVSFSDLRTSPTVLIGYSYTRWKNMNKEMRFFIDADRRPLMITDNGAPTPWALPHLGPNKRTDEDFAIVSRVFHPDTRTVLMEVAGITQYGTEAAAKLVSNPDLLTEALKGAPQGWQNRNLQFVLHTKVISGIAASQHVVAKYFW